MARRESAASFVADASVGLGAINCRTIVHAPLGTRWWMIELVVKISSYTAGEKISMNQAYQNDASNYWEPKQRVVSTGW
jgi:hypothetical protein